MNYVCGNCKCNKRDFSKSKNRGYLRMKQIRGRGDNIEQGDNQRKIRNI